MVLSNDLKLLSPGYARLSFKPSTSAHGFILLKVFQRLPAFPTSSLFRDSALTLRRIDPSYSEPCQAQLFDKANLPRQVNLRGLLVHPINPRPRYSASGSHLDECVRPCLHQQTSAGDSVWREWGRGYALQPFFLFLQLFSLLMLAFRRTLCLNRYIRSSLQSPK